ncbi:uncharacterized protein GIQ15_04338 [Arthroderma uncinatum]|uniref:uncharacterized protein n=1 Tax=Arthroderma uncinatum TaxID=74035 RepID=UPI00144AC8F5|nr:uncharacterized protein GIQ15_04338 [Arthroderma uncinatum]KAF3481579.1 hypothetical protein GIQ15_04338 [Arthroderma uncinatum]
MPISPPTATNECSKLAHREHTSQTRRRQPPGHNGAINSMKKTKKRGDALLRRLTRWLLNKQAEVSFCLLGALVVTHTSMASARPYTSKFLTLSYYNSNTGKYAAGQNDLYFVAFFVVLLTGLRAGTMEYIITPLAKRWGLSKRKEVLRFSEQGWMLVYYNVFWPLGVYIYYKSPYFLNMEELWTDWPQRELGGLMKGYMLGQWSFWLQQILVIHIEDRRKDHWQMLAHHFVSITLVSACYAYHQTRVGNLIMVLMDVVDLVFPLAKCFKYLGFTTVCDILFGVFIAVWFVSRHVFYIMTCWSVYFDLPRVTKPACFRGSAEQLRGPLPASSTWSDLLEPFLNPVGTVCWGNNIMIGFLSFLLILQVMMMIWSVSIIRVAIRVLKGNGAEDIRSDDEEDEGDEEEEHKDEAQPREEEVGVETIGLKDWVRRAGIGGGASSTSVRLSGQGHRKELLNRIGCEKQVD